MKFFKITFCIILSLMLIFSVGCTPQNIDPIGNIGASSDTLRVHFIDVGQGDSAFIEFPGGETMLIDAGENEYGSVVSDYIKNLGYNTLNYVVGTHPHSDHIGGLEEIIRGFEVESVYMPKVSANTKTFEGLLAAIKDKGLTVNTAKKDVYIIDKENLQVKIMSPVQEEYPELNNYSAVVMLTYFSNRFLFTGDAETDVEGQLTGDISCDVLKVGHHGSSTSSSLKFLKSVKPKYAVISCGKNNKYGHPHTEIISRLKKIGATVLRTDISGTIVIESDGDNVKLSENVETQTLDTSSYNNSSSEEVKYILNTSSKKIHLPDCGAVKDMKSENRAESYESIDQLLADGYAKCGSCKPE